MQTATYIDRETQEAVRAGGVAYIATDVAPGVRLDEYRRRNAGHARRGAVALMRVAAGFGRPATLETTRGGW
jgi:hypothetical protein